MLEELAAAAGSRTAAREYFKAKSGDIPAQNAALITALIAGDDDYAKAVPLLGQLVAIEPALPWAGAAWFGTHLADVLSPRAVAHAVKAIFDAVGYPDDPAVRAALRPWLGLARAAAARPDADAGVLCSLSDAARRLDAASEAVAWCEKAVRLDRKAGIRSPNSLIKLGFAQRDAGALAPAAKTLEAGVALAPDNAELHLDLADLAFDRSDFTTSLRWAERAAALDPDSIEARGAVLSAKARASLAAHDGFLRDAEAIAELFHLATVHPQIPYLRTLMARTCQAVPWLGLVPPPKEAIAASPKNGVVRINEVHMMALEAPSAIHAFRTRHPEARITVGETPEPDLRTACSTKYGPPLWTYQGTSAVPAIPPPDAAAVSLLAPLVIGIWGEPLAAYEHVAPLGALSEQDLLALLAHVPPPDERARRLDTVTGLYSNRVSQAWLCIGILHHRPQEPWTDSARRRLLLRLLHGPEDWTVDAAAFALCIAAWITPQHRSDIAEQLAERYRFTARAVGHRYSALHDFLAAVVLMCPGMDPSIVALAESNLAAILKAHIKAAPAKRGFIRRLTRQGISVAPD
ncbi:hypothetical protein [Actinospica robiniae]|uniref:hypothetical protein n=1 Tax=Actinospica robiniae TaxID=304901 RepID=UPI000402E6A3|nr:hypothetical protein [Actinospica robiniae]